MLTKTAKITLGLFSAIVLFTGCKGKLDPSGAPKAVQPYKVIEVNKESATLIAEYPATLNGIQDIEIRAKIDGFIETIHVDEGQEVKKGQLLFTINNPQYAQDAQRLKAALAAAESAVSSAKLMVTKTKPLVEKKIVSAFDLENAELNYKSAEANLAQVRAQLANAQTNVGYTLIKSPFDGVVGTIPLKIGSYVSATTQTPLTKVSDISKVYANFSINEKQQLEIMDNVEGKTFQEKIDRLPLVNLVLSNNKVYDEKGRIETFSGQINTQTGSFNVRASFNNPGRILRSGSSTTIQIPTELTNVMIIPQSATTELQNKRLAYIVGEGNKVVGVPIIVRPVPGGHFFVVDSGLKIGDKVIIEGIGIIAEGTEIKPQVTKLDFEETINNEAITKP